MGYKSIARPVSALTGKRIGSAFERGIGDGEGRTKTRCRRSLVVTALGRVLRRRGGAIRRHGGEKIPTRSEHSVVGTMRLTGKFYLSEPGNDVKQIPTPIVSDADDGERRTRRKSKDIGVTTGNKTGITMHGTKTRSGRRGSPVVVGAFTG